MGARFRGVLKGNLVQFRPNKKNYVFPVTNDPPKIGSVGRGNFFLI